MTGSRPIEETGETGLGPLVRLLLWDHARGSLAYDVAVLVVLLILLLASGAFWGDPLWGAR